MLKYKFVQKWLKYKNNNNSEDLIFYKLKLI